MARGNKMGPNNEGPMTGRKLGFCMGNDNAGFENGFGNGNRLGRGRGKGNAPGNSFGFSRGLGRNNSTQDLSYAEIMNRIDRLEEKINLINK